MRKITSILPLLLVIISFSAFANKNSAKSEEKVLHLESPAMPPTLDPAIVDDLYSTTEIVKVYEGLLEYHYLKRPAELIPNLAESMPEVSSNGLVYTFRIKKGVYFQDNECFEKGKGRELTAYDFVFSLKRFADPKSQSPLYSMGGDKILGLDEWRKKNKDNKETDYNSQIEGIKAVDKYTLKITLSKPWPQFLHILTMPHMMVVPKEAVVYYGKEFANNPVGTGPFVIKKFNPQENKIVAYKNPTYREKYYPTEASDECKHLLLKEKRRLPFIDRVETYVLIEEQPRWLKFISKKIDILKLDKMADLGTKIKNNEPIEEYKKQGILLMSKPTSSTFMYAMNNEVAPFKNNIYLRQAISMAYDRCKANELFNDNMHLVAQSFIPPTLAGYEKDFVNIYNTYNIEEAKKLMIKAGYPGGQGLEPIIFDTCADTRDRQEAEFFQNCMAKIGIKIIISVNSWPELTNKHHLGKTQIHRVGWIADYPDADNFLCLYNVKYPSYGNYYSAEYSKLYNKASVMNDSPERTELYKKMNRILAEDVPALYTTHRPSMSFYYSWVLNYQYFDPKRSDSVQYLDIDLEKKKELSK